MNNQQPQLLELSIINDSQDPEDQSDPAYLPNAKIKEFLYCISNSSTVPHACSIAGIVYDTMLRWLNPREPAHKPALLKLFNRAKALAFTKHIEAINSSKDWKAHAFWLSANEKDFHPKDPRNPQIINNIGISSPQDHISLSPDMLKSLSNAYDQMQKDTKPTDS